MQTNTITNEVFLTIRQVAERIALSKSTIYRRMDPKDKLHDSEFPRPIKLTESTSRWVEREVDTWMNNLIQNQRSHAA